MKYKVTIQRIEYRSHDFELEANSKEEARHLAIKRSFDHDFGEDTGDSADQVVTAVIEMGK